MGRPVIKNNVIVSFSIEAETKRKLQFLAEKNNLSVSSYIDFLVDNTYNHYVFNYDEQEDLTKIRMKELQIEKIKEEINEIDQQIIKNKEIKRTFDDNKESMDKMVNERKNQFIINLVRKFHEGDAYEDILTVAKNQSIILNNKWTAEELILEAKKISGKH